MVAVTTDSPDPLNEAAPVLDVGDLEDILARSWEVRGALTPLHGERDLNFRVGDPSGSTYVLKIQNPGGLGRRGGTSRRPLPPHPSGRSRSAHPRCRPHGGGRGMDDNHRRDRPPLPCCA